MSFTVSNLRRGSVGDATSLAGTFTSDAGDTTFTFTHGMYDVRLARFSLETGAVDAQPPKVTHSAGVATVIWDDTQGLSGTLYVVGK